MISIQEAIKIIEQNLPERKTEERALAKSLGYFLAIDYYAPEPLPKFDNSAMDGFAIALDESVSPELPLKMPVIGESQAGMPYTGELQAGEAIRISTGAVVPEGATQVIPVEHTTMEDDQVVIHKLGKQYAHIRFSGEEITEGEKIAQKHDKLTPPMISWLAGFGLQSVEVFAKPRIATLTTGQELVDPSETPEMGQIRNTNQIYFEQYLSAIGFESVYGHQIPDSLEETKRILREAEQVADIILVSGGVSVGPHDHVKNAAESVGFKQHFWKVAQKPGKPLYFATQDNKLLFGLPGNPVSTLMSTIVYVIPVLQFMVGNPDQNLPVVLAHLSHSYEERGTDRAKYLLVKFIPDKSDHSIIEPVGHQRSHMMSCVTASDGFILVPAGSKKLKSSDPQIVYLFPWSDNPEQAQLPRTIQWDT